MTKLSEMSADEIVGAMLEQLDEQCIYWAGLLSSQPTNAEACDQLTEKHYRPRALSASANTRSLANATSRLSNQFETYSCSYSLSYIC